MNQPFDDREYHDRQSQIFTPALLAEIAQDVRLTEQIQHWSAVAENVFGPNDMAAYMRAQRSDTENHKFFRLINQMQPSRRLSLELSALHDSDIPGRRVTAEEIRKWVDFALQFNDDSTV